MIFLVAIGSSFRVLISIFCSLCLMRIFLSALLFLPVSTAHNIIYVLMTLIYAPLYFLFFSIFLLFCLSDYLSVCQIKSNYFKVNITKIKITLFLLSLSELSVVLPSTLLPNLWKFGGIFLIVFHFAPSTF